LGTAVKRRRWIEQQIGRECQHLHKLTKMTAASRSWGGGALQKLMDARLEGISSRRLLTDGARTGMNNIRGYGKNEKIQSAAPRRARLSGFGFMVCGVRTGMKNGGDVPQMEPNYRLPLFSAGWAPIFRLSYLEQKRGARN
jgi:hypothetical protein